MKEDSPESTELTPEELDTIADGMNNADLTEQLSTKNGTPPAAASRFALEINCIPAALVKAQHP